jgi:hypothetical protein
VCRRDGAQGAPITLTARFPRVLGRPDVVLGTRVSGLVRKPEPLPGIEVSVGGAGGLIDEAQTSVRNVAIVRLIAVHPAGGAKASAARRRQPSRRCRADECHTRDPARPE